MAGPYIATTPDTQPQGRAGNIVRDSPTFYTSLWNWNYSRLSPKITII